MVSVHIRAARDHAVQGWQRVTQRSPSSPGTTAMAARIDALLGLAVLPCLVYVLFNIELDSCKYRVGIFYWLYPALYICVSSGVDGGIRDVHGL
jgi:hypothetical protein